MFFFFANAKKVGFELKTYRRLLDTPKIPISWETRKDIFGEHIFIYLYSIDTMLYEALFLLSFHFIIVISDVTLSIVQVRAST